MNDLALSDELRGYEVKKVILSPPNWAALDLPTPMLWTSCKVATTPANGVPADKKGVYTFIVQPGIADHPLCAYLMYVGKAAGKVGFRARYAKYLAERTRLDSDRPLVNRMIQKWFDYLWFCYAEIPDAYITTTEDKLLKAYLPPFCTQFPAEISRAMRAF